MMNQLQITSPRLLRMSLIPPMKARKPQNQNAREEQACPCWVHPRVFPKCHAIDGKKVSLAHQLLMPAKLSLFSPGFGRRKMLWSTVEYTPPTSAQWLKGTFTGRSTETCHRRGWKSLMASPINKGLRTVGFERGHWDVAGKVAGKPKACTLEEMKDVLHKDPDFAHNPTILQQTFADFQRGVCEFSMSYLAKFWCTLAWIEQYWNDCKQVTFFSFFLTLYLYLSKHHLYFLKLLLTFALSIRQRASSATTRSPGSRPCSPSLSPRPVPSAASATTCSAPWTMSAP